MTTKRHSLGSLRPGDVVHAVVQTKPRRCVVLEVRDAGAVVFLAAVHGRQREADAVVVLHFTREGKALGLTKPTYFERAYMGVARVDELLGRATGRCPTDLLKRLQAHAGLRLDNPERRSRRAERNARRACGSIRAARCLYEAVREGVALEIRPTRTAWAVYRPDSTRALVRRKTKGDAKAAVAAVRELVQTSAQCPPCAPGLSGSPEQRRRTRVVTPQKPAGEPARYELVEAADLVASHDPVSFGPDPRYPTGVQERQYHADVSEQRKVHVGAQTLDPAIVLATSPTAVDGPPLVTVDGVALGGNGRSMMIRRAYKLELPSAERYRGALVERAPEFGLEPEAVRTMRAPVLVRVVEGLSRSSPASELAAAVRRYNEGLTNALDAKAKAVAHARQLSDTSIARLGEVLRENPDASLRDVMRTRAGDLLAVLEAEGVVTASNRSEWTVGGELTESAKDAIEAMFLGRVLASADRIRATPPSLLRKLERAVPHLVAVAGRNKDQDLIPAVQKAVDLLNDAAARSLTLEQLLAQGSLFGGARASVRAPPPPPPACVPPSFVDLPAADWPPAPAHFTKQGRYTTDEWKTAIRAMRDLPEWVQIEEAVASWTDCFRGLLGEERFNEIFENYGTFEAPRLLATVQKHRSELVETVPFRANMELLSAGTDRRERLSRLMTPAWLEEQRRSQVPFIQSIVEQIRVVSDPLLFETGTDPQVVVDRVGPLSTELLGRMLREVHGIDVLADGVGSSAARQTLSDLASGELTVKQFLTAAAGRRAVRETEDREHRRTYLLAARDAAKFLEEHLAGGRKLSSGSLNVRLPRGKIELRQVNCAGHVCQYRAELTGFAKGWLVLGPTVNEKERALEAWAAYVREVARIPLEAAESFDAFYDATNAARWGLEERKQREGNPDPEEIVVARLLETAGPRSVGERFAAWARLADFDPRQSTMFGSPATREEAIVALTGRASNPSHDGCRGFDCSCGARDRVLRQMLEDAIGGYRRRLEELEGQGSTPLVERERRRLRAAISRGEAMVQTLEGGVDMQRAKNPQKEQICVACTGCCRTTNPRGHAMACEAAQGPRCVCRCQYAQHGSPGRAYEPKGKRRKNPDGSTPANVAPAAGTGLRTTVVIDNEGRAHPAIVRVTASGQRVFEAVGDPAKSSYDTALGQAKRLAKRLGIVVDEGGVLHGTVRRGNPEVGRWVPFVDSSARTVAGLAGELRKRFPKLPPRFDVRLPGVGLIQLARGAAGKLEARHAGVRKPALEKALSLALDA